MHALLLQGGSTAVCGCLRQRRAQRARQAVTELRAGQACLQNAHVKPFASSVSVSTSSLHCVQYTILLGYAARARGRTPG